jgi:DNA topoisomerase IB
VALAVSGPAASKSKTARKRAITRAVKEVAHYLGNTPAVCRASYIDPRVFDRYEDGFTIGGVLTDIGEEGDIESLHGSAEQGVLDLIAEPEESDAVEKVA